MLVQPFSVLVLLCLHLFQEKDSDKIVLILAPQEVTLVYYSQACSCFIHKEAIIRKSF